MSVPAAGGLLVTGAIGTAVDLNEGHVFKPAGGLAQISTIDLTVTNKATVSVSVSARGISRDEFETVLTGNGTYGCGPVPDKWRGPIAGAHLFASPADVRLVVSFTMNGLGYNHPGRRLWVCNSSGTGMGSWVLASSLCGTEWPAATADAAEGDSAYSGTSITFTSPVCHTTPYVIFEYVGQDDSALCAPGINQCDCSSTNPDEPTSNTSFYVLLYAGLVIAGLGFLIRKYLETPFQYPKGIVEWLRKSNKTNGANTVGGAKLPTGLSRRSGLLVLGCMYVGTLFIISALVFKRQTVRDPQQWIADARDEERFVFWFLSILVPLGVFVALGVFPVCKCFDDNSDGTGEVITATVVYSVASVLALYVEISPWKDDVPFYVSWVAAWVVDFLCFVFRVAVENQWCGLGKRSGATDALKILVPFISFAVYVVALVYTGTYARRAPCGNHYRTTISNSATN